MVLERIVRTDPDLQEAARRFWDAYDGGLLDEALSALVSFRARVGDPAETPPRPEMVSLWLHRRAWEQRRALRGELAGIKN
jgi:hypothetical protein